MISFPARSKIAAVIILFFVGTFGGRILDLVEGLRGKVEDGARITNDLRATVTTISQVIDGGAEQLRGQIADLQAKLASGTATPAQVTQLQGLVERLRAASGRTGAPGPPGPPGTPGPPGPPPTASSSTTGTGPGSTTTTTRPSATTTTTKPPATTTTTRCTVGVGRLLKVGCS